MEEIKIILKIYTVLMFINLTSFDVYFGICVLWKTKTTFRVVLDLNS